MSDEMRETIEQIDEIANRATARVCAEWRESGWKGNPPSVTPAMVRIVLTETEKLRALRAPGGGVNVHDCTCEYHYELADQDTCGTCGGRIGDTIRIPPEKLKGGHSVDDPGSVWG